MADALNATKGWPARADELWIAYASKVLPVPVSPRSTIGTSDFAASAASCKQRAMASLLVVRSSILSLESGSCIAHRGVIASCSHATGVLVRTHIQSASAHRQ